MLDEQVSTCFWPCGILFIAIINVKFNSGSPSPIRDTALLHYFALALGEKKVEQGADTPTPLPFGWYE